MTSFTSEGDYGNNATVIRIFHDRLMHLVSHDAVMRMIGEEIQTALTSDPELRILVREMIKEAISRMNVQEVVAEAVKLALKVEHGDVPKR